MYRVRRAKAHGDRQIAISLTGPSRQGSPGVESSNLNTAISYGFRTAVAVHFACLFVLIFVMRRTLVGVPHYVVAVVLTILMAVIAVLFVAAMATRKDERRGHSKLVDGVVGCVWFAVVGFLFVNSFRAGIW